MRGRRTACAIVPSECGNDLPEVRTHLGVLLVGALCEKLEEHRDRVPLHEEAQIILGARPWVNEWIEERKGRTEELGDKAEEHVEVLHVATHRECMKHAWQHLYKLQKYRVHHSEPRRRIPGASRAEDSTWRHTPPAAVLAGPGSCP